MATQARNYARANNQLANRTYDKNQKAVYGGINETNSTVYGAFDGLRKEHDRSGDYREQLGDISRAAVVGLFKRFPNFLLRSLYKLKETEKVKTRYDEMIFDGGWFDITPEEGLPRLLTMTKRSESKALVRRGLAVRAEATALKLRRGMEDLQSMISSVAFAGADTMSAMTIKTIVQDSEDSRPFQAVLGKTVDHLAAIKYEARLTGSLNCSKAKFVQLMEQLRAELSEKAAGSGSRSSGGLDLLASRGVMAYIPDSARDRNEMEAGVSLKSELFVDGNDALRAQSTERPRFVIRGVRIWEVPDATRYNLREHRIVSAAESLMTAPMSFAEWYLADLRAVGRQMINGITKRDGYRYHTGLRETVLYDLDTDGFVGIPLFNVIAHSGATQEKEPQQYADKAKLSPDMFSSNNKEGRRQVPWCYAYNRNGKGDFGLTGLYHKIKAWGGADPEVLPMEEWWNVADSMAAGLVNNLSGYNVEEMLARTQEMFDQMDGDINAEVIAALRTAGLPNPVALRTIDKDAAAAAGWPAITILEPDVTSGTLRLPSASTLRAKHSLPPGFATMQGLVSLSRSGKSGNGWGGEVASQASKLVSFWKAVESHVLACGRNVFLEPAARPFWQPRALPGAMALNLFRANSIPLFIRQTAAGVGSATGNALPGYLPYLAMGTLKRGKGNDIDHSGSIFADAPGDVKALVQAIAAENEDKPSQPAFGSRVYGSDNMVLLEIGVADMDANVPNPAVGASEALKFGVKRVILPADIAYAVTQFSMVNFGAAHLDSLQFANWTNYVYPALQTMGNAGAQTIGNLVKFLDSHSEDASKIMNFIYTNEVPNSNGAISSKENWEAIAAKFKENADLLMAAPISATKVSGGKKGGKETLSQLLGTKLYENVGVAGGRNPAKGTETVIADLDIWRKKSSDYASKRTNQSPFPYLSNDPSDDSNIAVVEEVQRIIDAMGVGDTQAIFGTWDSTKPEEYDDTRDANTGKVATADANVVRRLNDYAGKDNLATRGTFFVNVFASGGAVAGDWVLAPMTISYTQAVKLAGANLTALPGDPASNFTRPYFGKTATKDFADFESSSMLDTGLLSSNYTWRSANVSVAQQAGNKNSPLLSLIKANQTPRNLPSGLVTSELVATMTTDNFQRRVRMLPQTTNSGLRMMRAFALGLRVDSLQDFFAMCTNNVHVPLAFIIFMLALKLKVASIILVRNDETGFNYWGDLHVSAGTDPVIKVFEMAVTFRHIAQTVKRDNLMPAMSALIVGYISGGGTKWTTKVKGKKSSKPGDIAAAAIPRSEVASLPTFLSPTGHFNFTSKEEPSANHLHFSSAHEFAKRTGLSEKYVTADRSSTVKKYRDRRRQMTAVASRGQVIYQSPTTPSGFNIQKGEGTAARIHGCREGYKDQFLGNGDSLPDVEELENLVRSAGVNYSQQPLIENF